MLELLPTVSQCRQSRDRIHRFSVPFDTVVQSRDKNPTRFCAFRRPTRSVDNDLIWMEGAAEPAERR